MTCRGRDLSSHHMSQWRRIFKLFFTWRSEPKSRPIRPRLAPPATQQLTDRRILSISYHLCRLRFPPFLWRSEIASQHLLSFRLYMTLTSVCACLTRCISPEDRSIAPRALSRSKNLINRLLVPRASQSTHAPSVPSPRFSGSWNESPSLQFSLGIPHKISSTVFG
jgi:hypothetical protein